MSRAKRPKDKDSDSSEEEDNDDRDDSESNVESDQSVSLPSKKKTKTSNKGKKKAPAKISKKKGQSSAASKKTTSSSSDSSNKTRQEYTTLTTSDKAFSDDKEEELLPSIQTPSSRTSLVALTESNSSSTTPILAHELHVTNAFYDSYSEVIIGQRCSVDKTVTIEETLLWSDLMIESENANYILTELNGLKNYHYGLEYERLNVFIKGVEVKLDKHVYIYVHYLIYLMCEYGLEGQALICKARKHLTSKNYFRQDSNEVLHMNFFSAIEYNKSFWSYICRISESFKTKLFRKSKSFVMSLRSVEDFQTPTSQFISRQVRLCVFLFSLLSLIHIIL